MSQDLDLKDVPWIQTLSGNAWRADAPWRYKYDLEEIAHVLSHMCRYAGHTRKFYSVAQHSVLVAELVKASRPNAPRRLYKAALLHDAAEAFCLDVPSPIKHMPMMSGYRVWIREVEECIASQFGLGTHPANPAIKYADLQALATERRDILGKGPYDHMWEETISGTLPTPREKAIKVLSHKQAKRLFMRTWESIQ